MNKHPTLNIPKPLTTYLSPHPYPNSEVDEESLPIRLIDIDKTLDESNNGHIYFCKPNNWDFHMISHTWSQHIRSLSKAVADQLQREEELDTRKAKAQLDDATVKPVDKLRGNLIQKLYKAVGNQIQKPSKAEGCTVEQKDQSESKKETPAIDDAPLPDQLQRNALDKYTDIFQKHDWTTSKETKKAYLAIREFLQILKSEGVKAIWLDAICINQRSNEEKDREIPRMASYYKYTTACFVPINGFATQRDRKPPKMASHYKYIPACFLPATQTSNSKEVRDSMNSPGNSQPKMIDIDGSTFGCAQSIHLQIDHEQESEICEGENDYRWFSSRNPILSLRLFKRVWTLQELLLPKNVYFIVQMERWMENCLLLILDITKASHFCWKIQRAMKKISGMTGDFVQEFIQRVIADIKSEAWSQNFEDCKVCRSIGSHIPLLKRVEICEKIKQPRLYFVNSMLLLLGLQDLSGYYMREIYYNWSLSNGLRSEKQLLQMIEQRELLFWTFNKKCEALASSSTAPDVLQLQTLVTEIRFRECHEEHPQDRILGMLGLLGLLDKNHVTLTASVKKSEEEQLVELACQKGALEDEVLLQMCFMDPYGRNLSGMSWIPHFTTTAGKKDLQQFPNVRFPTYTAKVKSVSREGPITLESPIIRGRIRVQRNWKASSPEKEKQLFMLWTSGTAYFGSVRKHKFTSECNGFFYLENSLGYIYLPIKDIDKKFEVYEHTKGHDLHLEFEAWALPIFITTSECAIIICLHDGKGSPLHKIGRGLLHKLAKDSEFNYIWSIAEGNKEEVTIGGFGEDIKKHIQGLEKIGNLNS